MALCHTMAMPILAQRRYCGGNPEPNELVLDGNPRTPLPGQSFDWIGLANPDAEEMGLVQRQFALHALAVEDALNPTQLPKVEVYGQQLFLIATTAASATVAPCRVARVASTASSVWAATCCARPP